MSKSKKGICHICGERKKLTFEHLPPKKANNSNRARAVTGDELMKHIAGNEKPWDLSKRKYKELQQGMGGYTLCEECNNKTGKYYGAEYIKFASTTHKTKSKRPVWRTTTSPFSCPRRTPGSSTS